MTVEAANRTGDGDGRADRCFAAAVAFMASQPGGAGRTLAAHRRRPDGYCTGCMHTLARWPCTVARIAIKAEERHRL
ncbi:hypothetical protein ACU61A_28185 [Pseudonocardia sichuanensis]